MLTLATRTIELLGDDQKADAYFIRGMIHAAMGRLDEAKADFANAPQKFSGTFDSSHLCALLCLHTAQDQSMYRQVCSDMLAQSSDVDKPDNLNTVAWTCVLTPNAVDDPTVPLRLIETACQSSPGNYSYIDTFGWALYRAGRHDEAIQRFNDVVDGLKTKTYAASCFGLAMAHQRLGHTAEARRWLARAVDKAQKDRVQTSNWAYRLELDLFQHEAEALIGPPDPEPPPLPETPIGDGET